MPATLPGARGARIIGWGRALPDKVVTNADLMRTLDTSDEWIKERSGIAERRIGGTTAELSVASGRIALERAGIEPGEIDALVLSTTTPDRTVPATSATVQNALGLSCGAFDVNAACSGFVYALTVAHGLIAIGARILRGTDEVRGRFRIAVVALVGGIVVFQVQVTVRGFPFLLSNFGRRYDPSLMLLVVLVWVLIILAPTDRRSARMLQGLAAVLLTATAVASIVTLPREIKVASYPPRISEAVDVRRSLESCVIGSRFPAYASVQPDLLDVICDRYERINR